MNIFYVLSQGKSRLNEIGISAVLGYFLDSRNDHGLGDIFVREFIQLVGSPPLNDFIASKPIVSQVSLEEPYSLNGSRKDIDIQISLLNADDSEAHRIIIENKITPQSSQADQLKNYYEAVLEDDPELESLHVVFLTPRRSSTQLKTQYDNLEINQPNHTKSWIFWDGDQDHLGIIKVLQDILRRESVGLTTPISDYVRHTIKAFIGFIISQMETPKISRRGQDLGEVIDETVITLDDGNSYKVIRRDSTQIQVFSETDGEKQIARQILSKYIDENSLGIDHQNLNTRSIGRRFFELERRSK